MASEGLLMLTEDRHGVRVFKSRDEGRSWELEQSWLNPVLMTTCYHAACDGLHGVGRQGSDLLHQLPSTGRVPAIISRGTSQPLMVRLDCTDPGRLGVIWVDPSGGWRDLFFSQSIDHGETWSPPTLVNYESRGKPLLFNFPRLVSLGGVWNVIWPESRQPATQFDIYASSSSDGSIWSPAIRVNDDQTPGWQDFLAASGRAGSLFVVFSDYRDVNRFGDRDGNIYFARVEAPEQKVRPNVRVNDARQALQFNPRIAFSLDGQTLVASWSDQRNHLFGDIYASLSTDGGRTWSVNQRVNSNSQPLATGIVSLKPLPGKRFLFLYRQNFPEGRWFLRGARLIENSRGKAEDAPPAHLGQRDSPLLENLKAGAVLLEEDFEAGVPPSWPRLIGSWVPSNGSLLAFGERVPTALLADLELRDFVFEGRFRLHPRWHRSAIIGFRARQGEGRHNSNGGPLRAYGIWNHFRQGIKLYATEGGYHPEEMNLPMADRWFPLQNDTWYRFRLVVAGSALDYYIDDEWMLSFEGLSLEPGSLALAANSPVEFDDLRVFAIDPGK